MICPFCQSVCADSASFCANCGRALREIPRTTPEPPSSPPPPLGGVAAPADGVISGSFRDGWELLKRAPVTVLVPPLVFLGIQIAISFALASAVEEWRFRGIALLILVAIALGFGYAGYLRVLLRIAQRQPVASSDWLQGLARFPSLFVAWLLSYFAVLGGFILFVIPGIILALGFSQSYYLILDRDPGPVEALRRSWRMMKGRKLDLFLLQLAIGGICLLATIPFGLGLLLVVPWAFAIQVSFYVRVLALTAGGAAPASALYSAPQ